MVHLAIVDIHMLADKYSESVYDKDKEIHSLLRAMCVELTHPLKHFKNFVMMLGVSPNPELRSLY